jgi:hypothetical protein
MGIACKINRDSSGKPTSVTTESGNKSKLFEDALRITGNPQSALEVYATSFTEEFKEDVLEPLKRSSKVSKKLDSNGEPRFSVVAQYITSKNWEGKVLDFPQLRDIKKQMQLTPEFRTKVASAFYRKGIFSFNKDHMIGSGLYSSSEANNILSNPVLQDKLRSTIEAYMNTSDDMLGVKFQVLGEQGAALLDAKERVKGVENARRIDNLGVARSMESQKMDPLDIKRATGWERGRDGLWRYETIHDAAFTKDFNLGEAIRSEKKIPLTEAIGEDNNLIQAYPELKKMTVQFVREYIQDGRNHMDPGTNAFYDKAKKTIVFNASRFNEGSIDTVSSIMVHEVQHVIQEIEGHNRGGGEYTVFTNEGLVDSNGRLNVSKVRSFISNRMSELEVRIKALVENLHGLEPTEENFRATGQLQEAQQIANEVPALKQWALAPDSTAYGIQYYARLAGEVEARNMQERFGMSEKERAGSLLSYTEDMAPEDQVVYFSNDNNWNMDFSKSLGLDTKAMITPVIERLKFSGLPVNTTVDTTEGLRDIARTIEMATGNHINVKNSKGFIWGENVYLNSDNMTLDTPIHEFGHLWIGWAKKNRPSLYRRGIELIRTKSGKKYRDQVEEAQPTLIGELIEEEALAEAIGDQGAKFILKNEQRSYKDWIKSLWAAIKDALGLSQYSDDRISNMSLEEFSEAIAIDLMRGTNEPFKTRAYTIQPLLDQMLQNKRGKLVSVQTIRQITKQKGIKKIEKDIIEDILELPAFKGKSKIPFSQFEKEVQDKLLPLDVIVSSTYSTYGDEAIEEYFDAQETHIYNSPYKHGDTGHFNGDFNETKAKNFDIRELNGTYIVVDRDAVLTQENIQDNVYNASSTRQEAERWVDNFHSQNKPESGLFGHTRVWYTDNRAFMAEVQSDSFQKAGAEDMLLEAYRKNPELMNKPQQEAFKKIKELDKRSEDFRDSPERIMYGTIESNNKKLAEIKKSLKETTRSEEDSAADAKFIRSLETSQEATETVLKRLFKLATTGKIDENPSEFKDAGGDTVIVGYNSEYYFVKTRAGKILKTYTSSGTSTSEYEISESDMEALLQKDNRIVAKNLGDFDPKLYEEYFYLRRDLPKLHKQLMKNMSTQDKQWVAHRKNYTERLVREEIRRSAEKGYETFLIPSPRTLAIIEGYSDAGDGRMPYEVYDASDPERLEPGDTISMDGYEFKVIWSDAYEIEVVDVDELHIESYDYLFETERDFQVELVVDELYSELDNPSSITQEEWNDIRKPYALEYTDLSDIADEVEEGSGVYEINTGKLEEEISDSVMDDFDPIDVLENRGYENVHEHFGEYFYTDYRVATESLKQPDEYEEAASEEEFDLEDYNSTEQTVLRKYMELIEFFKKERGDNVTTTTDAGGNTWWSTELTPEDGVKPVVLFQKMKVDQQPLVKFFEGDKDTSKVNSLGMYESKNPFTLEKEAVQELGGIKDRKEFEEKLQASEFESLKLEYNNDQFFAEEFFRRMSSLSRIAEFKIENGKLVRRSTKETQETFEEVLTVSGDKISEQIAFMEGIPNDIWKNNPREVKVTLEGVRRMAVDMGLNLKNLEEYYHERSQEELINLLTAVKNLNLQPTQLRLEEMAKAYDSFYRNEKELSVKVTPVPASHKGMALSYLNTSLTEYEVFEKHGLLKVKGNLYQKIDKTESIEELYEQLTTSAIADPWTFYADYSVEPKESNREVIKEEIKKFVESKAASITAENVDSDQLLMMAAYKHYFKIEDNNSNISVSEEQMKYSNFNGDFQYLTTEFIADFNKASIRAEQSGNRAYEEFYSNFEIDGNGITLKNTDEITMETVRDYIDKGVLGEVGENLVQYSIISKNSGLDLIKDAETKFETDEFLRDFYVNNPKMAPKVSTYTAVEPGVIAVKGAPKFINTSQGLFEAVSELGNVGFYAKLPKNTTGYNMMGVEKPELGIELSKYSHLQSIPKSSVRISKKITRAEEQRINKEKFNCE